MSERTSSMDGGDGMGRHWGEDWGEDYPHRDVTEAIIPEPDQDRSGPLGWNATCISGGPH